MRPPAVTAVTLLAVAIAGGVIGNSLHFSGPAWLATLLVSMFLVSLVDRQRFYDEPHPFRRLPRR